MKNPYFTHIFLVLANDMTTHMTTTLFQIMDLQTKYTFSLISEELLDLWSGGQHSVGEELLPRFSSPGESGSAKSETNATLLGKWELSPAVALEALTTGQTSEPRPISALAIPTPQVRGEAMSSGTEKMQSRQRLRECWLCWLALYAEEQWRLFCWTPRLMASHQRWHSERMAAIGERAANEWQTNGSATQIRGFSHSLEMRSIYHLTLNTRRIYNNIRPKNIYIQNPFQ